MFHLYIYFFTILWLATCQFENTEQNTKPSIQVATIKENNIIPAAERLVLYHPILENKKVGLVVNQTSLIKNKHIVDTLLKIGVDIHKVFAPEHGFRGDADAGETIKDSRDPSTSLPIISLYGNKKKPSSADLDSLDVILFDIQDVGVRFYTYISTLHYIMQACAENNIPLIVLDRPNPNGFYIDGPVLKEGFSSFVGLHPVPVVYGMTIGEYAKMILGEKWLKNGIQCDLTVIECKNYSHDQFYELPVRPSPNLPNARSILLYPSLCFFEGTTVSVGRGTEYQFQCIGHPLIKSSFHFTPQSNYGAKSPPHQNKTCFGLDLTNLTIQQLLLEKKLNITYLIDFYKELNAKGELFFLENLFFDKLAGTDSLRKMLLENNSEVLIRASWEKDIELFKKIRLKYLLYD